MLDELRSHFPAVQSLLMDRATTLFARAHAAEARSAAPNTG
ncbi:MAG: hypothetical protein KAX99_00700 [Azonexus sp.]|nr:hypothetical protein [Azonexus sp.]